MARSEFTDGMKRLLRTHPALLPERTRELAARFLGAQEIVCRSLSALGYPLERVVLELKSGQLPYFREGSDQDRKRSLGRKVSYRFAGFAPSHVEEYESKVTLRQNNGLSEADFEAWQTRFLMGFTFDVIEQAGLRSCPPHPVWGGDELRAQLDRVLSEARRLRDEILLGNLLLVAKLVMKRCFCHATVLPDDLFTAGMDGLLIAIGRYDPAVGQFSTYATPWITMAIDRFAAKTRGVIRIPIGMQDKARQQRNRAGGNEPGLSPVLPLIPLVQSLEDPIPGFDDSELRLEDVVADPQASQPREVLENADVASILCGRMLQMDELKQFILAMRNDVGDALGLAIKLFQDEAALSVSRGRATAAAATKSFDEPASICMIGGGAEERQTLCDAAEAVAFEIAI